VWFLGKERGTATGTQTALSAVGGIAALSLTNSVVMPLVGNWRNVFLVYGFTGFLIAGIWMFLGRRSPPSSGSGATTARVERVGISAVKEVFKSKNVWLLVTIGIASFLTNHGLANWLPKMLQLRGMTPEGAGFAMSMLNVAGIVGTLMIPRLPDLVGTKKLAISLCLFTQGISILILGMSEGTVLWLGLMLDGLSRGFMPLLIVTLMELPEVGSRRMGIVGGLYFAVGEIGGFGGPFIMGVIKDITDSFLPGMILLTIVCEASIGLAALLKVETRAKSLQK
jgi:cyanate permease